VTEPTDAAEQLNQRLARLRGEPPFRAYERARREVLRMKTAEREAGGHASGYWREELGNLEYLLDASPLIVEKLRHHTLHVTGIKAYEYRTQPHRARQELFAEKLAALREADPVGLFVPESPVLGGFGFSIDGDLVNLDTLKFYEVLIALERGGVLTQFRDGTRRVVIEPGPGWGGFAYQFHTLFPNTCYVLVDLPELFLLSSVYLATLFPEARVAFWDDAKPLTPDEIVDHDFVFIPYTSFPDVGFDRVDLALNMVSFQEMTTAQVEGYVQRFHELGCRFLYSLNRDRSGYNTELSSVREIMGRRYSLTEIPVLPVAYTTLVSRAEMEERRRVRSSPSATGGFRRAVRLLRRRGAGTSNTAKKASGPYRHVIGRPLVVDAAPQSPAGLTTRS
jgi:hypothetical protein